MRKLTLFLEFFILIFFFSVLSCDNNDETSRIISALIGPEGGSTTSAGGKLTLNFPPGALSEETEITIRKLNRGDLSPEFDDVDVDSAYEFLPKGLEFNLTVAATVKLQTSLLDN